MLYITSLDPLTLWVVQFVNRKKQTDKTLVMLRREDR